MFTHTNMNKINSAPIATYINYCADFWSLPRFTFFEGDSFSLSYVRFQREEAMRIFLVRVRVARLINSLCADFRGDMPKAIWYGKV